MGGASTPLSVCQNHNTNILCKSAAETRAQYVAQLLGSSAVEEHDASRTDERPSST
jgi:hypothetical protein